MTKAEYIERYGLERYEQLKVQSNARCKERYMSDPVFRKSRNERNNARKKERYWNDPEFRKFQSAQDRVYKQASYVEGGRIDLIENYDIAMKDNLDGWDIHHKLEIHDDYINSLKHMKLMNLYYNRPPAELIWLRNSDHKRLHAKSRRSN